MIKILLSTFVVLTVSASADLSALQWGLKNTGQTYKRFVDKYRQIDIEGLPGIDINYELPLNKDKEIVVAVIDTGVDVNHKELEGRIWKNPKCDDPEYKGGCHGVNVLDDNDDIEDTVGHGTFIAGIIAAKRDGQGIDGLTANNIKIMPIKAVKKQFKGFMYNGKVTSELMANGVVYAVRNGAHVINLSLGYPKILVTPKVTAAFDYAAKNNVIIIAAAGNNNKTTPVFPCNYKSVLCVGAIDSTGEKVVGSNYGHKVDVFAPGEKIVSLLPSTMESQFLRINGFDTKSGSSYAAPFVTALAALIKSKYYDMRVEDVIATIIANSKLIGGRRLVDYKRTLRDIRPVLVPHVKNIDEITVNKNKSFSFDIPLTNHFESVNQSVKILTSSDDLVVEMSKYDVEKISSGKIRVSGSVKNFEIDANQTITIRVDTDGSTIDYKLYLKLNMIRDRAEVSKKVEGIPARAIIAVSKIGKRTSLKPVLNSFTKSNKHDFFFSSNGNLSKLYVLKENEVSFRHIVMKFEQAILVDQVLKVDINNDQIDDYFVYGKTQKGDQYFFAFYDSMGKKLYENNFWKLPGTQFGGLSFTRVGPSFSFIKLKTESLGIINLPVFKRTFRLPIEDNSMDPIDRLSQETKNRFYYFLPVLNNGEADLSIRTIENYENIMEIRKILDLDVFEQIDAFKVRKQSVSDLDSGITKFIFLVGEGALKEAVEAAFLNGKLSGVKMVGDMRFSLNQNLFDIYEGYNEYSLLSSRVIKRNLISFRHDSKSYILKNEWSNPFLSLVDSFSVNGDLQSVVENRYDLKMYVFSNGEQKDLGSVSIERESSYAGRAFSQSFSGIHVSPDQIGVFTDTKDIFGNTVGVLVRDNDKFILPLKYNFLNSEKCISIGNVEINNHGYIQSHCTDSKSSWIERTKISI